ncbi:MAG: ATP-binding protein, partial [Candidatus Bipolaricaulis sp.]|nr:ATP-binding protein [Candidatus Bipolaricaulis sp.]
TAALYSLTRELAGLRDEALLVDCSARHAAEALGAECTICLRDATGKAPICATHGAAVPAHPRAVLRHGGAHGSARRIRLDVSAAGPGEAAFVPQQLADEEERAFLRAFARQVSLAVERVRLADAAASASLRARAEEARNSLLSAVSHDLRTPLATIAGAGTALQEDEGRLSGEQRVDLLTSICDEAERMDRYIANILDMARLGEGGVAPAREWVPLEEVVGSTLDRLDTRLIGCDVTLDLPEDLPLAWIDPVLFEHVLANLIENAVKHADRGRSIRISARRELENLVIVVADRGPGIPEGAEQAIFERFYRGPGARGGGVGLGLAICRVVVKAHGGEITAENRDGGGAAFRITLPLPPEAPTARDVESETPNPTGEEEM